MTHDSVGRADPEVLADLANGGPVAAAGNFLLDEVEDLALTRRKLRKIHDRTPPNSCMLPAFRAGKLNGFALLGLQRLNETIIYGRTSSIGYRPVERVFFGELHQGTGQSVCPAAFLRRS